EKEPYGCREHVVWESQRVVGEPVDIPKLRQGQVRGDFVGLPDICGPVVRGRVGELGCLPSKPIESNYEFRDGCNFGNRDVENLANLDAVDVSLGTPPGYLQRVEVDTEYELPSSAEYVRVPNGSPTVSCLARGPKLRDENRVYVATGVDHMESQYADCTVNALYWQVVQNVMGEH